ncbi:Permease of the drug/metabolite transporter (DMT) superfamily [Cohnella sp. OV330]|uniref:DMT family transporter n=1 Tax=Cohnella sp. OV330 TaxID=1855288 RepID=UPI0008E11BA0|nr:DMT family transporter [Cohnella sp. OV330]SFA75725.1 Permease of the drug/metabolite transporter (DMT) superfamily [Cohnella sp. OV330]
MSLKGLLIGILFTVLYSSGAIIMKIGLHSASPLTLATLRFLTAGVLLLIFIYGLRKGKYPLPNKREWGVLMLLGLLNTSLFVGLGNLALRSISAGIFNLFLPINPFVFAIFSFIFMGKSIRAKEWTGMAVSAVGLFIATYPSLARSHATLSGIILLVSAMVSMAVGSLVFKKANLQLPTLVINAWQVFIGGIILIVPTLFLESGKPLNMDIHLVEYLLWSVVGLSIISMGLWFHLLKHDAVRANNWLLLNPVSGYVLAAIVLGEPLTWYAVIATVVVLMGLYLSGNFRIKRDRS